MSIKVTEREWTDVTIISVYVDRGNVMTQEVQVTKTQAEADMLELIQRGTPEGEDIPAYTMPDAEFKSRVMRAIQVKLTTPIQAESKVTNEVRLLPPSAYREVIVRVNNLGKVLEA